MVLVFLHERGIFSALIIRSTADRDLVALRHTRAFEAAAPPSPGSPPGPTPTSPSRSPTCCRAVRCSTSTAGSAARQAALALPGLVFVGDSVCTTTPNFGRGLTTSLTQVSELLRLVDVHGSDVEAIGEELDTWDEARMRPWVEDHITMDHAHARRWAGDDIDLSARLPSDVIMMAAAQDPSIGEAVGPYLSMQALPSSLGAVEDRARAVYRTGWRPQPDPGPTRDALADVVAAAVPA